jgi:hypothetical protein
MQTIQKKLIVRHSPRLNITLPPLTDLEARRQAKAKGVSLSRHIAQLIERESVKPQ